MEETLQIPGGQTPEENAEYAAFVEKFKPKKTTDDCYTPAPVYDAVVDWVLRRVPELSGCEIVRPFWPGGDYESFDYPKGCVVIDNPPFSIQSKIVRFFIEKGIRFFLFAPAKTPMVWGSDITYIIGNCPVVYENGAAVATSFVSNLFPGIRVIGAPDLYESVKSASSRHRKSMTKKRPSISYPIEYISPLLLDKYVSRGLSFEFRSEEMFEVKSLDKMKEAGKDLFGQGWLVSTSIKKRLEEMERKRLEEMERKRLEEMEQYSLSERELRIVAGLDK